MDVGGASERRGERAEEDGMKNGYLRRKGVVLGLATLLSVVGFASLAHARHGEVDKLANRIPEPAPYVVAETTAAGGAPHTGVPFEPLWNGDNNTGGCDGCHTGLWEEWNGAMMSNAWRDPGWRGAFLLVARLTSTDGNCDTPNPPDNSPRRTDLNPFGHPTLCQSTYNVNPATGQPFPGVSPATYDQTSGNNGSGSLMDDFCSRCHMPSNYADATTSVATLSGSGWELEHGSISPRFDPTDCVGPLPCGAPGTPTTTDPATGALTPESFAQRFYTDGASRPVNTNSGKAGITCEVCHTNVETRFTPYHYYNRSANANNQSITPGPTQSAEYYWATGAGERNSQLPTNKADMLYVPDPNSGNLGYGVGAGAFRLSPHALKFPDRFGPLTRNDFTGLIDPYIQDVFNLASTDPRAKYQQANEPGAHTTYYQVKFERAEFCASCHDVTNPLTIKNEYGYWVGGFPIERTYTEWKNSRYADRTDSGVLNPYYDPNFKRDCMTCHMQQSYGQPGTAISLMTIDSDRDGIVDWSDPLAEPSCDRFIHEPGYSHHFVGGNGYMTRLIGADVDGGGTVKPYPELLNTSFSSTSPDSRFYYARFDTAGTVTGGTTQHERFAWDRLRNALSMTVPTVGPVARPPSETTIPLTGAMLKNEGSGHNFPTGFPEGRAAWVAVRAFDLGTKAADGTPNLTQDIRLAKELQIQDNGNNGQRSLGFGYLTAAEIADPNYPTCTWHIPEGGIDPYAYVFRAVATADKNCPTLELPYATPVNLVVNAQLLPFEDLNENGTQDANERVIDGSSNGSNPLGIPRYTDNDPNGGNGDVFDDSFLTDTRLQPCRKIGSVSCGNAGAMVDLSRYAVVVPSTIRGPIAVTTAVYYQSFEAVVAKDFLGNLANLDDTDTTSMAGGPDPAGPEGLPGGRPTLEPCVLKGPCDRIGKAGATGEIQLRNALRFDPVVVEGAPPVPAEVRNTVIQVTGTSDTVAPWVIINNSKINPNTTATIPANRHWSPSPYGGATGNYATEGYGELGVAHTRIIKVSFNEPVTGVDANTFYLTNSKNKAVDFLIDQIDDTTWALFPYVSPEAVFLSGGGYIIHVAPSRNGSVIQDYAGNPLTPGPAANQEYTFGFKAQ